MGTGLRGRLPATRTWLALAGLVTGMMIVTLPAAEAAAAPQAGRFPIPAAAGDAIGQQVAMSGSTAAIGAPGVNGGRGAIYIFVRSGRTWHRQATLRDPQPEANSGFGGALAVSSTRAGTYVLAGGSGHGYVFVRSGQKWHLQATLSAASGGPAEDFGASVALSPTTALVSTIQSQVNGLGGVYVFVRSGEAWHQQAILLDPDTTGEDEFGDSLAVSGATIVASAPNVGCTFVFTRSGQKWTVQATLITTGKVASCPFGLVGGFGTSVAMSGLTVVIGDAFGPAGEAAGDAFVFTRSGTAWSRQAKLADPHGVDGDYFGWSAALSGDTALIGAPFRTASHCGAAYEYTRSGATWRERAKLVNHRCSDNDQFGSSVTESGSTALIGAPGKNKGAGAAYWQTLP